MTFTLESVIILDTPQEQQQFSKKPELESIPIGINEGAKKYGVPQPTITRWVHKGYIRILGNKKVRGGMRILIDEGDLEYCSNIHNFNPAPGRKLFNPDGTPYTKK